MSPSLSATKTTASPDSESRLPALFANLSLGLLGLWLLAAPSQFSNHWPSDFNLWPQSLALLLLGGVALLQSVSGLKVRLDAVGLCLVLFLGWNLVATLLGVYRHDAWLELARITGGVFVYFAVRAHAGRLDWLVVAAVVGALYTASVGLIGFFSFGGRQFGGYLNPNLFAAMLTPAMVLSLLLPVLAWRRTRSALAAGTALLPTIALLLALVVTGSKGGFVAALVALLVFAVAVVRAKGTLVKGFVKRAWPILLVAVLVLGAVGAKSVGPRLLRAGGEDNNSTLSRVYFWRGTLDMVKAKPVFGFGPDGFPTVFAHYAQGVYARTAHESWLQIAAEGGVPALVFLLGALVLAVKEGWRKLKTNGWARAACGLAAITGIVVHGFFDAGWSVTPVVALLSVALVLCVSDANDGTPAAPRGLNLAFLGATLLLIFAGFGTQKAATAEELLAESEHATSRVQATNDILEAVQTDPSSARVWQYLAQITPLDDRKTWEDAYQTAAQLQPDSASHPRGWASHLAALAAPTAADVTQTGDLLDHAITLDPLNTELRLERANWRLGHKDGRGYDDLEWVLKEWDEPYGKYPALGRDLDVNLDFARATLALAPRLKAQKKTTRLQALVKRSLEDVALAKTLQKANAAMVAEMEKEGQGQHSLNRFRDLPDLERGLRQFSVT